jgi:hypothetical protein
MAESPTAWPHVESSGSTPLTVSAGAIVPEGTYYGDETTIAFAAAAAVSSGDDGTLTYAWTVIGVPEGSGKATGDITSPTSLTGATLDDFDEAGWYTFRLTTTRASDAVVAISDRAIYVGIGQWFSVNDDISAESTEDWKAGGDATYSCGSVDYAVENTAGASAVGVVNGSGFVVDFGGSVTVKLRSEALASILAGVGRYSSFAVRMSVTITNGEVNGHGFYMYIENAAKSSNYGGGRDYTGSGRLVTFADGSNTTIAQAGLNGGHQIGLVTHSLDFKQSWETGLLAATPEDPETWDVVVDPDGCPTDQLSPFQSKTDVKTNPATDHIYIELLSNTAGSTCVMTIDRIQYFIKR